MPPDTIGSGIKPSDLVRAAEGALDHHDMDNLWKEIQMIGKQSNKKQQEQDMCEINKYLHEHGYIPNLTLEGLPISVITPKNTKFYEATRSDGKCILLSEEFQIAMTCADPAEITEKNQFDPVLFPKDNQRYLFLGRTGANYYETPEILLYYGFRMKEAKTMDMDSGRPLRFVQFDLNTEYGKKLYQQISKNPNVPPHDVVVFLDTGAGDKGFHEDLQVDSLPPCLKDKPSTSGYVCGLDSFVQYLDVLVDEGTAKATKIQQDAERAKKIQQEDHEADRKKPR